MTAHDLDTLSTMLQTRWEVQIERVSFDEALKTLPEIAKRGLAVTSVSIDVTRNGKPRPLGRWVSTHWQVGENWPDYAARSVAQVCEFIKVYFKTGPGVRFTMSLGNCPDESVLRKSQSYLSRYFASGRYFSICSDTNAIPMVAANVSLGSSGYFHGQRVLIWDVYWGMNERARVIRKLQGTKRWVVGVFTINNLVNFRPFLVRNPRIKWPLCGATRQVDGLILRRFWLSPCDDLPPLRYSHGLGVDFGLSSDDGQVLDGV